MEKFLQDKQLSGGVSAGNFKSFTCLTLIDSVCDSCRKVENVRLSVKGGMLNLECALI